MFVRLIRIQIRQADQLVYHILTLKSKYSIKNPVADDRIKHPPKEEVVPLLENTLQWRTSVHN